MRSLRKKAKAEKRRDHALGLVEKNICRRERERERERRAWSCRTPDS